MNDTTTQKPKAYSYLRFSTPEQTQGDSFRRQATLADEWAKRHGVELDGRSYQDLGVSAYRGANAETGMLGEFRDAVRIGAIERGSYLLIESLDRLSRNKPRQAIRLLERICEEGITVVTLTDGKMYSEDALDDDPMAFMWAFMVAIRANEESAMKARRLRAAWEAKRKTAATKPLTATTPARIRLNKETGQFELIEERAAIVRRIIRDYMSGKGKGTIAKELNAEGVDTWSRTRKPKEPGQLERGQARHWHLSYITKILENPALCGVFIPHVSEYVGGKRRRKALEPVEGYYPALLTKKEFEEVRALAESKAPVRGRHVVMKNVLSGLATCVQCGSSMVRTSKGPGQRVYFVCATAKAGGQCDYKSVRYDMIEEALVDRADELPVLVPTTRDSGIEAELRGADERVESLNERLRALTDALSDIGRNQTPVTVLREIERLEAEKEEAERDRAALVKAHEQLDSTLMKDGAVSAARALREMAAAEDETERLERLQEANRALRKALAAVEIDRDQGELWLVWKGDVRTPLQFDAGAMFKAVEVPETAD